MQRVVSTLVVALAAAAIHPVLAQEGPKRKPGLWEIKSTVMGMNSSVQQCVGPGSDDLMARQARDRQHADCSATQVTRQANGVRVHSVCKMEARTVTTDGEFTGSFDSAYKGKLVSKMDPPQNGVSSTEINIDARWTGPCAANQKPGDMVVSTPGGQRIDMNDPRIREAMEKMRAAQGAQK